MTAPPPRSPLPGVIDRAGLSREIWRLAVPAVLQQLFLTSHFFVDTKMIADYGGADPAPLAAMGVIGPLVWSVTVIATITSIGTTAIVARRIGAGRAGAATHATRVALLLALGTGVLVAAAGVCLRVPIVALFTSLLPPDEGGAAVAGMAERYLYWVFLLFPLRAVVVTLEAALRGAGESVLPFLGGVSSTAANIAGNFLWIFGSLGAPELGVEGAGLATGLAPLAELALIGGALALARSPRLRVGGGAPGPREKGIAREILRISAPALVGAVTFHAGFLVYQSAIFGLDPSAIAAHRVAITLQSLGFLPAAGFHAAAASLSGRLLGAGDRELAREAAQRNLRLGLLFVAPVSLGFLLAAGSLVGFIAEIPGTIAAAACCLRIGALEIPFLLATESLTGTLRGAGATRAPMRITAIGTWGVRVPLAWILAHGTPLGLAGIWVATVVDWIVRGALTAAAVRSGAWLDERA
jgi:putative MATE family efflux protein